MIELAQAVGPTGRVDALDLSEAMIDQARAKSEKLGLSDRVHFKQGNARELPSLSLHFLGCVSSLGRTWFIEPLRTLKKTENTEIFALNP